jgi:hypothetical protein
VGAVATVAAFLPSSDLNEEIFGEEKLAQRRQACADARRKYEGTGEVDVITVYSETDPTAVNFQTSSRCVWLLPEREPRQRPAPPERTPQAAARSTTFRWWPTSFSIVPDRAARHATL